MKLCSICQEPYSGYGNNPEPVKPASKGQCCDTCNHTEVIRARLLQLLGTDQEKKKKKNIK